EVGIDLVCCAGVGGRELAEDFVPLVHIALVELVMSLDGGARDPVQLQQGRLQLTGSDLLVTRHPYLHIVRHITRRERRGAYPSTQLPRRRSRACRSLFQTFLTPTTRSSRRSTRARWRSTTPSTIRPTSTTRTRLSRGRNGRITTSNRSSRASRRCPTTSRRRCGTTRAATQTTASSGRS